MIGGQWEAEKLVLQNKIAQIIKDRVFYKYAWIDAKVNNGENTMYLKNFKTVVHVQPYENVQALKQKLKGFHKYQQLVLICAASLKNEQYQHFQNHEKISTMILFCYNQERGKSLASLYPKILRAIFSPDDVISLLILWLAQQDKIQQINKISRITTVINLIHLITTDRQMVVDVKLIDLLLYT